MDTPNLSKLVSYAPGFLYKFIGDVSTVTDISLHVTRQLVAAINDNTVVTNVLILKDRGIFVHSPVEVTSDEFISIGAVESELVEEVVDTPEEGV